MPQVVEREEEVLRKQAEAAILSSTGGTDNTPAKPAVASNEPGRNDMVTISNGSETRQLKYKKAQELLASGWVMQ